MRTVSITGASGFVGRHAVAAFVAAGWHVRACARSGVPDSPGVTFVRTADVTETDWAAACGGASVVVHVAGLAHRLKAPPGQDEFERVNVRGALAVAAGARAAGARRLVFVSSIGVSGEHSLGRPLTTEDPPRPATPYAASKLAAERVLAAECARASLELVVVRPALVCGPDAPGNLRRLAGLVARGWPLPFGGLTAPRSFVGVRNLADFLVLASERPEAAGRTFLLADDPPLSTLEVAMLLATGQGASLRAFRVPVPLLRGVAGLLGRADEVRKLSEPLLVDASPAHALGWTPRVALRAEMLATGTPGAARGPGRAE